MQSENLKKTIYAAILGAGTVGTGVYKLCQQMKDEFVQKTGADLVVKKVLVRNASKKREGIEDAVLTDNWKEIIEDPEIDIVIEVMGGIEPAKTYIIEALEAGKQIVTANKDLLAEHGQEVMAAAEKAGADLEFEAAVAGAIPIIRPLNQSLTADEITQITGILNGTTNYILTKMSQEGSSYEDVLKEAQDLGYAERNPEADVEGYDTCRKIAILTSLAFGSTVKFEEIQTEGITKISTADFAYAEKPGRASQKGEKLGCVVKLLATSFKKDEKVYAITAPFLIDATHPLYNVNDVLNGIYIHGNVIGDVMFFGAGAGKLPTASAVVADVVEMAKNVDKNIPVKWSSKKLELVDYRSAENRFFVRVSGTDKTFVEKVFGNVEYIDAQGVTGELGFVTEVMTEEALENKKAAYGEVLNVIRVA